MMMMMAMLLIIKILIIPFAKKQSLDVVIGYLLRLMVLITVKLYSAPKRITVDYLTTT
jgi:membrane protein YdbS with pleckstrin-like domain